MKALVTGAAGFISSHLTGAGRRRSRVVAPTCSPTTSLKEANVEAQASTCAESTPLRRDIR
jgi:nucleoside-diphosphate-sugar epimerase